jgi:nitrate/nitrite transporter NarK
LSFALLLAAVGVPRKWPSASPRRVSRIGFGLLLAGIVLLIVLLKWGTGPEIVTWPLILVGLGIGSLASQLGAVTASSVPDERTGEVGGLQNTATNLGASIATALAGAVLISALTTSLFDNLENNPAVPATVLESAQVSLAAGVPFVSDAQLDDALTAAGVAPDVVDEVTTANSDARINALRASFSLLAMLGVVALFFTGRIPDEPATKRPGVGPEPEAVPLQA